MVVSWTAISPWHARSVSEATRPESRSPFTPIKSSVLCPRSLWWLHGLGPGPSNTTLTSTILFDNNPSDHSYSLSSPPNIDMGSLFQLNSTFHSHVIRCNQGKERIRRAEEIVLPQIERLKPLVSKRVFEEMKTSKIRGDKKYLKKYHFDKCVQLVCLLLNSKQLCISLLSNTIADCATERTFQAVQMQSITLYDYSTISSAPCLRWLHSCFVKTLSRPNAVRFWKFLHAVNLSSFRSNHGISSDLGTPLHGECRVW